MANILNLPDWRETSVFETDDSITIHATYEVKPAHCPKCNQLAFNDRYGTVELEFVDQPIRAKHVTIVVQRQKYRCTHCKKVYRQPLGGMSMVHRATERLVIYVAQQAILRTFTAVAQEVGLDERTVRRIFDEYVGYLTRSGLFATPTVLGIDEVYLVRKPRAVFTNISQGTIYDILPNRRKDTIYARLMQIPNKEMVRAVCMDMWAPYRWAVRTIFPDVPIIIDKFHVVRMATDAMERVRKTVRASLKARERRALRYDRKFLLKRNKDLDARQQLMVSMWTKNYPLLGEAYRLKEAFYHIYDVAANDAHARLMYRAWESQITPQLKPFFKIMLRAMRNWDKEIFEYFNHRFTNAFTEATNGLIKMTNRNGRGYSFKVLRAKMLYNPYLFVTRTPSRRGKPLTEFGGDLHEIEVFGPPLEVLIVWLQQGVLAGAPEEAINQ